MLRGAVAILLRQIHRDAQCSTTRNDSHLVDGVVFGHQVTDNCVARFVIRRIELFFLAHDHGTALRSHHDFVFGQFELLHADNSLVLTRSKQSGLVDKVCEIRAGETRRTTSDNARDDIVIKRHFAHVHFQDLLATPNIRQRHDYLAVETSGTQQSRIQYVGPVGRCDNDNSFAALETIHFDKHLVQRLFPLVVPTAQACATVSTNGIELVNKDNARCLFFCLVEHVTHA